MSSVPKLSVCVWGGLILGVATAFSLLLVLTLFDITSPVFSNWYWWFAGAWFLSILLILVGLCLKPIHWDLSEEEKQAWMVASRPSDRLGKERRTVEDGDTSESGSEDEEPKENGLAANTRVNATLAVKKKTKSKKEA